MSAGEAGESDSSGSPPVAEAAEDVQHQHPAFLKHIVKVGIEDPRIAQAVQVQGRERWESYSAVVSRLPTTSTPPESAAVNNTMSAGSWSIGVNDSPIAIVPALKAKVFQFRGQRQHLVPARGNAEPSSAAPL